MIRNVSLDEISDGRLYELNDMVKADCNDCKGCSACCQGMGESIVLDPLDLFRITKKTGKSFEELMKDHIELHVVDGTILPNLKMNTEKDCCSFLNVEGRCSIHDARPGICRLFPLGRFYEDHGFKYFIQVHECPKENKTKVKVKKWIATDNPKKYEEFIVSWHFLLKDFQEKMKVSQNEIFMKEANLYVLKHFYVTPYSLEEDFYPQFQVRYEKALEFLI